MSETKRYPGDYSRPDWLPDWRDPNAYTEHGRDLRSWAWEFLRRNPEYQADYAHYMSLPWFYSEGGGTPKRASRSIGDFDEMIYLWGSVPALPGETAGEYEHRTGEWPVQLECHLLAKWRVTTLEDPAHEAAPSYGPDDSDIWPQQVDYPEPFLDFGPREKQFGKHYEWMAGRLLLACWRPELDNNVRVFAFDLRRNIDDQVGEIRDLLKELQNEARRPPTDDVFSRTPMEVIRRPTTKGVDGMLNDLRILDAIWSGESWKNIATALWGNPKTSRLQDGGVFQYLDKIKMEQRIKDAISRAKGRVIEGGYQDLLLWAEMPQSRENKTKKARKLDSGQTPQG